MKPGTDYIGVGCGPLIINDKGETLLIKRGAQSRNEAGFWSKPGGKVEFGESGEEASKRETKEELGIDVEIIRPLGFTDHRIVREKQHWIALNYLARIVSGEPRIMEPDNIAEVRWFSFDNLPSPLAKTTSDAIAQYRNFRL